MKPMRLHHVGIIMTTMEKAEAFLDQFGLEKDYMEYVESYHAYCLFTKYTEKESPVELIIPTEGVLTEYNKGKGGIHHIAFEVEDVEAAKEAEIWTGRSGRICTTGKINNLFRNWIGIKA